METTLKVVYVKTWQEQLDFFTNKLKAVFTCENKMKEFLASQAGTLEKNQKIEVESFEMKRHFSLYVDETPTTSVEDASYAVMFYLMDDHFGMCFEEIIGAYQSLEDAEKVKRTIHEAYAENGFDCDFDIEVEKLDNGIRKGEIVSRIIYAV